MKQTGHRFLIAALLSLLLVNGSDAIAPAAQDQSELKFLMSDGGDSCRDQQAQAAASIRDTKIQINTIGFDVGNNQQAQGDLGFGGRSA